MNAYDLCWWGGVKTLLFGGVVLVVWLLLPCLRLRTPRWHRLIWGAVLAVGLLGAVVPVHVPTTVEPETSLSDLSNDIPVDDHAKQQTLSELRPVVADGDTLFIEPTSFEAFPKTDHAASILVKPAFAMPSWPVLLLAVWITGMFTLAGWRLVQYLRLLHHLKTAVPAHDDFAEQWTEILHEYGVEPKRLALLLTDGVGPALVRLPGGSTVVAPRELWEDSTSKVRLGILKHEIAHYLHGDLPLGFLARLVGFVHWFNPTAWLAVWKFEEAAQWCADAEAFGNEKDGELVFAESMLALHNATPSILLNRPAFDGGKFPRRVRFLRYALSHPKESVMKRTIVIAVVLCVLLFGAVRIHFVPIMAEEKKVETIETETKPVEKTPEKPEDERLTAPVSGRVLDEDGKPIEGTQVFGCVDQPRPERFLRTAVDGGLNPNQSGRIGGMGTFMTGPFSTDAEGRYEFKTPPDGELKTYFCSESHAPTVMISGNRGKFDDTVLKSRTAVRPTVHVLSPDGKPVSDVWVQISPVSDNWAVNRQPGLSRCEIAKDGKCTFKPLLPGPYTVSVVRRPLVLAPPKEPLDSPFLFMPKEITVTPESDEFLLRATESSMVTLRFSDKRDISDPKYRRENWPHQIVLADERHVLGWHLRLSEGESLGDGEYRYRVPRDIPIEFYNFQRDNIFLYRLTPVMVPRTVPSVQQQPLPPDRLPLGHVEKDIEIELTDLQSPTLNLEAVGEDGKTIRDYWAYCTYPDNGEDPGIEQVDGGSWRLKGNALARLVVGLSQPEFVAELKSGANFSLDSETGTATVKRIYPDKKMFVFLFDKRGRQGFLDLNLKPGSEETKRVTLRSTGETPEIELPELTLRGRFVDEQGKPVPNVKLRIYGEKPAALKDNAYDRFSRFFNADAEGRFSCELLTEGEASVQATPKHHAAAIWCFDKIDRTNADLGDLVLKSGVRPVARVLTPDGKPQPGIGVGIWKAGEPGDASREITEFYLLTEKPTDNNGTTTLPMLSPGKYRLSFNDYRVRQGNTVAAVSYPTRIVEIMPENTPETIEIEVKAVAVSAETIFPTTGNVVDEQDKPVSGAEVQIRITKPAKYRKYLGDTFHGYGRTDAAGRFTIRYSDLEGAEEVQEGKVTVSVHFRNDDKNELAPKTFETDLISPLDNIVMEKGVRSTVRVLTAEGKPVAGAYVSMSGRETSRWSVQNRLATDENGRCTMPPVPPGPCVLMLIQRTNHQVLEKLPCVFLIQYAEVDKNGSEIEFRGVETVALTLKFADEIIPLKPNWLRVISIVQDETSWVSDSVETLGGGVYRIRVPKNLPLRLRIDNDDDWAYSYNLPGGESVSVVESDFGKFETDTEIRITRRKAARAEIRCVDEHGKPVDGFYLIGMYPDYPIKDNFKTETVGDGLRLDKADLDKRFLSTKSVELYDFGQSFRFPSPVAFDWNAEERRGRVLRIQPDETIRLFVFDRSGRQGYVETTFGEGEQRRIEVKLDR